MSTVYFAGWDGGATSTTIECINENRETVLRVKAGPLNAHGNSPQKIGQTIKDALSHMSTLPGGLAAFRRLCIGGAGASGKDTRNIWTQSLEAGGFHAPYDLVSDFETAFYGAFSGASGIVLISGTGTVCYGMNETGAFHRCGGWGHRFDDEGSGYAIGRDVLKAVVKAFDGRAKATVLAEKLFDLWNINNIPELITKAYAKETGKKEIAALAALCDEASKMGDEPSIEILKIAADSVVALLSTTADKLAVASIDTVLMGGAVEKGRMFRTVLDKSLPERFLVCEPKADAAKGAALMALHRN